VDRVLADPADPRIGRLLAGRYRIERVLARGGMGRVYLATQLLLERPVAIKILNPDFAKADPHFARRFLLEASTSARLVHPNVVTVHDYGESEMDLFMAMEFLNGRPLSHVIAEDGAFSAERTLKVAIQLARALREAHAHGVIHRDLKPANVMLIEAGDDPDVVKVLDFGLVKLFQPESGPQHGLVPVDPNQSDLTGETLLGSPRYMSPEQIRGDALDPRTDIYSLGVIMFQMIAGRAPFNSAISVDVIYKHLNEPVPEIAPLVPAGHCPPEIEQIIRRAMMKVREDRYPSMRELIVALKEAEQAILTQRDPGRLLRATDSGPTPVVPGGRPLSLDTPIGLSVPPVPGPATRTDPDPMPLGEAAFREVLTEEPLGASQPPLAKEAPGRTPLVLASLGLLIALATFAVVLLDASARRTLETTSPAAAPAPAPAERARPQELVRVAFESDPPGAAVREGDALLGVTPFAAFLFPASEADRSFVFELAEHEPAAIQARISGASKLVRAELRSRPASPGKTKQGPPGYRHNPY
jgi:serine/threonine-protein kinase